MNAKAGHGISSPMRWLFPVLVVVALVFGASHAGRLIYWVMGPWNATAVEQDGSLSHMQFGQNLPRPEWVPVYPGAWTVQSSTVTSQRAPSGFHSLEIGTRAPLEDVKRFYTERLKAAGFEVTDLGTMSLNPATAAPLRLDGALSARRASTDEMIDIQIRTPDGMIPSRLLQIHWHKISEYPLAVSARSRASGD